MHPRRYTDHYYSVVLPQWNFTRSNAERITYLFTQATKRLNLTLRCLCSFIGSRKVPYLVEVTRFTTNRSFDQLLVQFMSSTAVYRAG